MRSRVKGGLIFATVERPRVENVASDGIAFLVLHDGMPPPPPAPHFSILPFPLACRAVFHLPPLQCFCLGHRQQRLHYVATSDPLSFHPPICRAANGVTPSGLLKTSTQGYRGEKKDRSAAEVQMCS